MQAEDLDELFILPLSAEVFEELENLQAQLQILPYDDSNADSWAQIWGNKYSSRRFYHHAFSQVETHPIFKVICKSKCTPQVSSSLYG